MSNPLQSFLSGQESAIGIQQNKLALDEARQSAPQRAAMRDITLERQKQVSQGFNQKTAIKGAQLMDKSVDYLIKSTQDPNQRFQMYNSPQMQKMRQAYDIQSPEGLTPNDFSDESLMQLKTGLGQSMQQMTGGERQREQLKQELQGAIDPNTGQLKPLDQMTPLQISAARKLDIIPGAGTDTEKERLIKDPDKAAKIGEALATIDSAVTEAKIKAKGRGDTSVELASAEAAMPGVEDVVEKLKILSEKATFTLAGEGFNAVAKQFGFSTSGDTAKSSMVAMVDNQVLPLLKPIFGAAFTANEGDRLRNAFLDPGSTPDSRKATLDAFLNQLKANIESKKRELSATDPNASPDSGGAQSEIDALRAELNL